MTLKPNLHDTVLYGYELDVSAVSLNVWPNLI
jgi:hypothetical protein